MLDRRPILSLLSTLLLCVACGGSPVANEQSGATAAAAAPVATDRPPRAFALVDSNQPATRALIVHLDPAQTLPGTVAIYAEIPGEGPAVAGQSYFLVEGAGANL